MENILYGKEARDKMLVGITKLSSAVKVTLGGAGRNAVYEQEHGSPMATRDGVSVSKIIHLQDKFESIGAEVLKEVALKTNELAGDGTTNSIILAEALIKNSFREIENGESPIYIKNQLQKALPEIVSMLKAQSKQIKTKKELEQVAMLSAQDEELGKLIADVLYNVGKEGVVSVQDSDVFGLSSEVVKGLKFDKGYISPYMITDNENMEASVKNAKVLIIDTKITAVADLIPLFEKIADKARELVIIADDYDLSVTSFFVANRLQGKFNAIAIKSPSFGDNRKKVLEDIAILTGATVVSTDKGMDIGKMDEKVLGSADKIVANQNSTTIIGGHGKKTAVSKRITQIKAELAKVSNAFDKDSCRERIAKLSGGISVIKIGMASELESKEKKDRIDDAVNATRAAMEEGIIAGGGLPLLAISDKITTDQVINRILSKSLSAPFEQIIHNSGEDVNGIRSKIESKHYNEGYDVSAKKFGNMFKMGIVDPLKVARTALENAFSVAGIALTTEVLIALEDKEEPINQM